MGKAVAQMHPSSPLPPPPLKPVLLLEQQLGTFFKSQLWVRILPPLPMVASVLAAPEAWVAPEPLLPVPARFCEKPGSTGDSSSNQTLSPCLVPQVFPASLGVGTEKGNPPAAIVVSG